MAIQSTNSAQLKYRRGTILGLTVAEIFILLLFLLMLVFLVLNQEHTKRLKQKNQQLEQLQIFRGTWEEALTGIETPDEIVDLKRWRDVLASSANESKTDPRRLEKENEQLLAKQVEQQKRLDEQQEQLEELLQRVEEYRMISVAQRILLEKGTNPPCWYEIVPAASGRTREKAFYLFDIAVFDEHMIVRRRPVPPGGATNDRDRSFSTYTEEAEMLSLDEIQYETPLSDIEIKESLGPISSAAKESRVRSYSCVFFVQVWDKTSESAKERWQQAHERVLQGLFGTFRIRDEQWQLL